MNKIEEKTYVVVQSKMKMWKGDSMFKLNKWFYSVTIIVVLGIVVITNFYIIDDQSKMYNDLFIDYRKSQNVITELNKSLETKNAEIEKLQDKIPQ